MFYKYEHNEQNHEVTVCGIPFNVMKSENDVVKKIPQHSFFLDTQKEAVLSFDNKECNVLFFLGMATDSIYTSEWWGQQECAWDYTVRTFFGDRLARIRVIFDDNTEELISVIFGVNAWNYNLYYGAKPKENMNSYDAPYAEPFISDANAAAMKDKALCLMENTDADAEKCTKWVFGYRINNVKKIKEIRIIKEESKQTNVAISAVTGLLNGSAIDPSWRLADQDFFLSRAYYADMDRMARRLYQFKDELPQHDPKVKIDNFDAPDITFEGAPMAEVYTNVYRVNIMDMAHGKVDDDGRSHTSTPLATNFGCYLGFGTFKEGGDAYGGHVWTRDIGRTLMELTNVGYGKRTTVAADYLHKLLYYPNIRFKLPHWKRVANIVAQNENDLFNEGKENDGHAAVMLSMYTLYRKGVVGKDWLFDHEKELKDAADYYLWQRDNPAESNFSDILYSESETSTQNTGGYDLFSNIISSYAMLAYSRLFNEMGRYEYAKELEEFSSTLRNNTKNHFLMKHPRYGDVFTDTTDDCWTYEYKRMVDLLIYSDMFGYDMQKQDPELFEFMSNTFEAQKEIFYAPESGRQMGYGQGYLTQQTIMLDRYEEMTDCIEAAAMFCYHHTDHNYIVPEGVIVHGSKKYWYRNSDQGNAVQQAEIVKCARLILGVDDIMPTNGIKLVPRLPLTWNSVSAVDFPVAGKNGEKSAITFKYQKGACTGKITATCGNEAYTADWKTDADIEYIRMGPFASADIKVNNGDILEIRKVNNNYFAYVRV